MSTVTSLDAVRSTSVSDDHPVVVVGTGLAGITLARELRRRGAHRAITLVSADSGDAYAKPALSNALAQRRDADALVNASSETWARELNVTVLSRTRVLAIDRDNRLVQTDRGPLAYGRLVLAVGADPIRISLAGDGAHAVCSINDLEDYRHWRSTLDPLGTGASVAVIGAGLIGSEFADDLSAAGYQVTVIDPATRPLANLAPQAIGLGLQEQLRARGVRWLLGRKPVAVRSNGVGAGYALALDDGSCLSVRAILSAVGLRPRTALARACGLAVDRGIVVDDRLASSDPEVSALGDCAQIGGSVRPFVMPLMASARALAATLSGDPTALDLPPMPVIVKTPSWPIALLPVAPGQPGGWEGNADSAGVRLLWRDGERLLGFALAGQYASERSLWMRQLHRDRSALPAAA